MGTPFRNAVAAALLGVALCGCANLRWQKDGVDAATFERDSGECRARARLEAGRLVPAYSLARPYVPGNDVRGRPGVAFPYLPETDYFLMQRSFMQSCMQGKGYTLVPVERPRPARANG